MTTSLALFLGLPALLLLLATGTTAHLRRLSGLRVPPVRHRG